MDQIFGFIERITFANPENGFTVARLKQPRKHELTTIEGSMPGLMPGESVRLLGKWKTNPTHGLEFVVSECHVETPKAVRTVMLFLQKYSVSPAFALKLYKLYGDETIERIQENPYMLVLEIRGIGFKTADTIAEKLGFPKDATQRIDAGIEYTALKLIDEGHTCYSLADFYEKAQELLEIDVSDQIKSIVISEYLNAP